MILLVDVGNSRIKWTLWDKGQFTEQGQLFHKEVDPGALGTRLWSKLERPQRVVVANVAGAQMATVLADWVARHWAIDAQFVTAAAAGFGIRNAYPVPGQMGVDRWVAMIGARDRITQACCVVDCGTAITIDALSAEGTHLGGVIFPGIRLMREALYRDTRQIPPEPQGQVVLLGNNTRDCVWGGSFHAVAAAIDGIVLRMEKVIGVDIDRLLTGGDAEILLPYLAGAYRLEPDLLFRGLLVIAKSSVQES